MVCGMIDKFGTEELRQKYLPKLCSMEVLNLPRGHFLRIDIYLTFCLSLF